MTHELLRFIKIDEMLDQERAIAGSVCSSISDGVLNTFFGDTVMAGVVIESGRLWICLIVAD